MAEKLLNYIYLGEDNPRALIVPENLRKIGVENDHFSEDIVFYIKRYTNSGKDLMEVGHKYINYINLASGEAGEGIYEIEDAAVSEIDSEHISFSWKISNHVAKNAGPVAFVLCFKDINEGGVITYEWNTEYNADLIILKGLETGDSVAEAYPDILSQWLARMEGYEQGITSINDNVTSPGSTWSSKKIEEKLTSKVAKGEGGAVTLDMLANDVKVAMTGGSVAVVGYGAVGYNSLDKALQELLGERKEVTATVTEGSAYYGATGGGVNIIGSAGSYAYSVDVEEGERFIFDESVTLVYFAEGSLIKESIDPYDSGYSYIVPDGCTKMYFNGSSGDIPVIKMGAGSYIDISKLDGDTRLRIGLVEIDISPNMINPDNVQYMYTISTEGVAEESTNATTKTRHCVFGIMKGIPGTTYYISYNGKSITSSGSGTSCKINRVVTYDADMTIKRVISDITGSSFTLADDEVYFNVNLYCYDADFNYDKVVGHYQLEAGAVTAYRPYGDKEPYVSSGDVKGVSDDVKAYVDSKIAELQTAMAALGTL